MRGSASLRRLAPVLAFLTACAQADPPPQPAPPSTPKDFAISAREVSEANPARSSRVLFLPFENRTSHRIAPSYLRAFDTTLAAFAAAMLRAEVVDPEVAGVLGRQLGLPLSGEPAVEDPPSLEERLAAARGAGATRVVWGVLAADGRLALEVASVEPTADVAPWNRLELTLEGAPDWAYYDGPRQLLAALLRQRPVAAATQELVGPPDEPARAAFGESLAAARQGELAMRAAEIEFAKTALAHPGWVEPWIALASLRAWRVASEGGRAEQHLIEGPSPARHLALLLGPQPAEAAQLAAVDWIFTSEVRPATHIDPQIAALPADAVERLMLAEWEGRAPGDRFALGSFVPRNASERAQLVHAAAASDDAAQAAILKLAEETPETERFDSHALVRLLERAAQQRNDWGGELGLHSILSAHEAMESFALLRGECARLEPPHREQCAAALAGPLGAEGGPQAILDEAAFPGALSQWVTAHLRGRPESSRVVELPEVKVFQEDRQFAAEWLAAAEVAETANSVLRIAERSRGSAADPVSLLASPVRTRLAHHLERLIESAYEPVQIVMKRGDAKTSKRYLNQLLPFQEFPAGSYWNARIREKDRSLENAAKVFTELAKRDPYDERWVGGWLHYVGYKEAIGWDDSSILREARWLETLVPRTRFTAGKIVQAWQGAKRPDLALATIARLTELKGTAVLPIITDDVLRDLNRPLADRIALLERARLEVPADASLQARLLDLLKTAGDVARAESVAKELLKVPSHHKAACEDLADLAAIRGKADEGGEILLTCIDQAFDKWAAANLWVRYANGLQDRGRFEEAVAAFTKAYERIGGASHVLTGRGHTLELMGRYDDAAQHFQRVVELYSSHDERRSSGRWNLYWLFRRQEKYAEARAAVEKLVLHATGNPESWRGLRFTYQLAGELPAFEELCRGKQGTGPLEAMSEVLAERGEYARAIELLEKANASRKEKFWLANKARLLFDAGRADEAIQAARSAHASDPTLLLTAETLVDLLLATGRTGDANAVANEYASLGQNWSGRYLRAKVLRAKGRRDEARRLMQEARSRIAWGGDAWTPERQWLPFEVSLGLPPRGSQALDDLARRLELALLRRYANAELWKAMSAVRKQQGDAEGVLEANARAAQLVAGKTEPSVARLGSGG
jgi:tetratricopeptide (TPR) repeat protein